MLDQNDTQSTWPFDYIPTPILDGILDHLILMSSRPTAKLPSELKSISCVNKDVRGVILARMRPFETIKISTEADSEASLQSLGHGAFTEIKSLFINLNDPDAFTTQARRVTERISKLNTLTLAPVLAESMDGREGSLRAERILQNPLHPNLKEVKILQITCNFRTTHRGSRPPASWAKINYSCLGIHIAPYKVKYRNSVSNSMNLSEAKFNLDLLDLSTVEVAGRLEYRPQNDTRAFILALLRFGPASRNIKITFFLSLPDRSGRSRREVAIPYRSVMAKKVVDPSGTPRLPVIGDFIDYKVLHKCVDGAEDWLERSPQYDWGEIIPSARSSSDQYGW